MSTRLLAKKLGLIRQRSQSSSETKKYLLSNQIFSYLIVIDFESTCWREKNYFTQEIIEFPAVFLNTSTGEVESEFHTYVQPQEHPILSEFCTELTGITQVQVEAGIPLHICLSRFNRWIQKLQLEKGVSFAAKQLTHSTSCPPPKLCAFLTWSDWDLGVCLQYECKRKQLQKPNVLNSWIDLRNTYRLFYCRKPKGLNGALQDLGIQFSGREHSGLDDARNTAQLAARMMRDGCVLKITRSLERTPVKVKTVIENNRHPAENKKNQLKNLMDKENVMKPSSSNIPLKPCKELFSLENSNLKKLLSPETSLNITTLSAQRQSSRSATARPAAALSSTLLINHGLPTHNSSHVLCTTTVGCLSLLPLTEVSIKSGPDEEETAELSVETDERCGSYDDVSLDCDYPTNEMDGVVIPDMEHVSDFDSGCFEWEEVGHSISTVGEQTVGREMEKTTAHELTSGLSISVAIPKPHSTTSDSNTCFAVPKVVDWGKHNRRKTEKTSQSYLRLNAPSKSFFPSLQPLLPEKSSTSNLSTFRHKSTITNRTKALESFSVYAEPRNQAAESPSSCLPVPSVLSALPTNTLSSTKCCSIPPTAKGPLRITSPLCECGRRTKRQVVSNGGPNHGRGFYCCPVRRSAGRGIVRKGCEFFKWESALMNSSSVAGPAQGSSTSLCDVRSAPLNRAAVRKSY